MKITLIGSARFELWFNAWEEALTLAGHLVYSLAVNPSAKGGRKDWHTPEQKVRLDTVHLLKICASEAVLLLNVDGYVGESTKREVDFALLSAKRVFALESWGPGCSLAEKRGDPSLITSHGGFDTDPWKLAPLGRWPNDPRDALRQEEKP